MSKVVLGSVALGLNGAVIAGGGWIIHTGIQKGKVDAELVDSLEKFQSQGKDEGCVTSLFGDLGSLPTTTDSTSAAENIEANFFGTEAAKPTTGCLVVNWDKGTSTKTNETNKWKGNIRFLWAVKGGNNKGFIAYLLGTATKETNAQSIKWSGVAYTLTRGGDDQTWTAKKKGDVPTTAGSDASFQKVDNDAENNKKKFPSPGTALNMEANSEFWGFFSSVDDLANICGANECTDSLTQTQFRGYWDWAGKYETGSASDNRKKLSDWTQDLEKCCQAIFGDQCKVKSAADQQIGTWTERVNSKTPPTPAAA